MRLSSMTCTEHAAASCPFSHLDYLAGLANIGAVETHPERRIALLRRRIPGTDLCDGVGPWPYRRIARDDDIDVLLSGFPHLVTLSVVTHPGWVPPRAGAARAEVRLLKQHYMYDPDKPPPPLSQRSRRRILDAERRGRFAVVTAARERMRIVSLYRALVRRRGLSGGFFDMPPAHFKAIARLPGSVFFEVRDDDGIGAMACGVVIGDMLQVLHLVTTERGLTWNAAYLLMHGLQGYARENGLRFLTGGLPMRGAPGLAAFKRKWVNATLPVHLLCVTNDPAAVDRPSARRTNHGGYFPPYRAPD